MTDPFLVNGLAGSGFSGLLKSLKENNDPLVWAPARCASAPADRASSRVISSLEVENRRRAGGFPRGCLPRWGEWGQPSCHRTKRVV